LGQWFNSKIKKQFNSLEIVLHTTKVQLLENNAILIDLCLSVLYGIIHNKYVELISFWVSKREESYLDNLSFGYCSSPASRECLGYYLIC
jgi:hypothetical protein